MLARPVSLDTRVRHGIHNPALTENEQQQIGHEHDQRGSRSHTLTGHRGRVARQGTHVEWEGPHALLRGEHGGGFCIAPHRLECKNRHSRQGWFDHRQDDLQVGIRRFLQKLLKTLFSELLITCSVHPSK